MKNLDWKKIGILFLPLLFLFYPALEALLARQFGERHLVQVVPIDPRDLLRGHYLALRLPTEALRTELQHCDHYSGVNAPLYVQFAAAGTYSTINKISDKKTDTSAYQKIDWARCEKRDDGSVWLTPNLPPLRYYMNQYRAQDWETRFKSASLELWLYRGRAYFGALTPSEEALPQHL